MIFISEGNSSEHQQEKHPPMLGAIVLEDSFVSCEKDESIRPKEKRIW